MIRISGYAAVFRKVSALLQEARHAAARRINGIMTAAYWEIGRNLVQTEMRGRDRAGYGEKLISLLSRDLSLRFGRGFSKSNLYQMRAFHLAYKDIFQTVSGELEDRSAAFPLPWSHYVRLMSVVNEEARRFYEAEALRGGWTIRELDRQIQSLFYERVALSRNKGRMLAQSRRGRIEIPIGAEQEIKDPFVLEFLDLKDEYSELELEDALVRRIQNFLLELGGDFAFIGRQRRLRIGGQWFRIDLLFFHRRLRCLVIIDLKTGKFTPADAGQMHLYLNYAAEHWTHADENPPVGLILCSEKDAAVAHYALSNLRTKVLAAEYRMKLPAERRIAAEIQKTRRFLEDRSIVR